ncbi:MAG: hypothetical protein ACKO2G_10865 [Verrucomicrobiales bacterium]
MKTIDELVGRIVYGQMMNPRPNIFRGSVILFLLAITMVHADQASLRKSLVENRWRWQSESAFENSMPWSAVYFDEDGTFRAMNGFRSSFRGKWSQPENETGVVHILNKDKVGVSLRFKADTKDFEASNAAGTKVAVGAPLFKRGLADLPMDLDKADEGQLEFRKSLKRILTGYAEAKAERAENPKMVVYQGSMMDNHATMTSISWLMPVEEAEKALFKKVPVARTSERVTSGFPNGLSLRIYDVRAGIYDSLTLVIDRADQVVALQLNAEKEHWAPRTKDWRSLGAYPVADFIHATRKDSATAIRDLRAINAGVVVNNATVGNTGTATLYIPTPLIGCLLANLGVLP